VTVNVNVFLFEACFLLCMLETAMAALARSRSEHSIDWRKLGEN
jgi:hypothetical protein